MDDDSGMAILGGGILLFALIGYIIYLIVMAVLYLTAIALGVAMFIGFGMGANLLVRIAIGAWAGEQPTRGQLRSGLTAMFLSPPAILLGWLAWPGVAGQATLIWFACALLAAPAYYYAYFAHEVPHLGLSLDLSLPSDAAMRAELQIWLVEVRVALVEGWYHTRMQLAVLPAKISQRSAHDHRTYPG